MIEYIWFVANKTNDNEPTNLHQRIIRHLFPLVWCSCEKLLETIHHVGVAVIGHEPHIWPKTVVVHVCLYDCFPVALVVYLSDELTILVEFDVIVGDVVAFFGRIRMYLLFCRLVTTHLLPSFHTRVGYWLERFRRNRRIRPHLGTRLRTRHKDHLLLL